jgi:hypothetical protein
MSEQSPFLGSITTRELLDELDARNVLGQRAKFKSAMDQAGEHIRKLRVGFAQRDGGLDYRTEAL